MGLLNSQQTAHLPDIKEIVCRLCGLLISSTVFNSINVRVCPERKTAFKNRHSFCQT